MNAQQRTPGGRTCVVALAVLLPLIVGWYTPAFLYSTGNNHEHFHFPLAQVLPVLGIGVLAAALALTLLGLALPRRARRYYSAFLAAMCAYVWVQGFVLVRDYGLLDGQVDLPPFTPALSVLVGCVLVVATVVLARIPPVRLRAVAAVLVVALVAHIGLLVVRDPKPRVTVEPSVSSFYEVGRRNLLVILLDSLQSDVFQQAMDAHPDVASAYSGFTYYPDTVGAGPTTYGSLPTIHSGRMREPGQSMKEHFDEGIGSESFEAELAGSGWDVGHLNPIGGVCADGVDPCFLHDPNRRASSFTRLLSQSAELADLTFFRLASPELKGLVYNHDRWRLSGRFQAVSSTVSSDGALREYAQLLRKGSREKVVRFLHMQSTHPPMTRAADCSLLERPTEPTRHSTEEAATCALRRVATIIGKLKRLDVYDDTSIVLLADHGYQRIGNIHMTDPKWFKLAGSANPLLAVKPAGATGDMITSDAQMSLVDIKTIACGLTDGCDDEAGDWMHPPDGRTRNFMWYQWFDRFWFASSLKDEHHYAVNGPITDADSWTDLGLTELPDVDELTFNEQDHVGHFGYGWGQVDPSIGDGARWGVGTDSLLNLRLPKDATTHLSFHVATLPEFSDQAITLSIAGTVIDSRELNGSSPTISFDIPGSALRNEIDGIKLTYARHRPSNEIATDRHEGLLQQLAVRFDALRISMTPEHTATPTG